MLHSVFTAGVAAERPVDASTKVENAMDIREADRLETSVTTAAKLGTSERNVRVRKIRQRIRNSVEVRRHARCAVDRTW